MIAAALLVLAAATPPPPGYIPKGQEPIFGFLVVHRGAPTADECRNLERRMREELAKGHAAGRQLVRATMPRECRALAPAKSYQIAGRRAPVPVEWVEETQIVAAWARTIGGSKK